MSMDVQIKITRETYDSTTTSTPIILSSVNQLQIPPLTVTSRKSKRRGTTVFILMEFQQYTSNKYLN